MVNTLDEGWRLSTPNHADAELGHVDVYLPAGVDDLPEVRTDRVGLVVHRRFDIITISLDPVGLHLDRSRESQRLMRIRCSNDAASPVVVDAAS